MSIRYSTSPEPVVGPFNVSRPPPVARTTGPPNAAASSVFTLGPPVSSAASIESNVSDSAPIVSVVAPSVMSASRCSTKVSNPPPPWTVSLPAPPRIRSFPALPVIVSSPAPPSRMVVAIARKEPSISLETTPASPAIPRISPAVEPFSASIESGWPVLGPVSLTRMKVFPGARNAFVSSAVSRDGLAAWIASRISWSVNASLRST